jgi:hypothetical protein
MRLPHPCHSIALTFWIQYISQTGLRAVLPPTSCPSKCPPLFYRTTRANPRSIPHSHGLHPSPFYSPPSLSLRCYLASRIAYVITPRRSFLVLPIQFCPTYRPILLHSSHLMSCPPPPALCFRYAAMPLSADTSCTATPFRPTFVASVSIPLALHIHIRLLHLSCRFPHLSRAVLVDSDGDSDIE